MEEEHTIVRFEDVWYHYPRTKAWSLKEITLSIKKGSLLPSSAKMAQENDIL